MAAGAGSKRDRSRPAPGATIDLRRALLRWYRAHRRDLPWRRTSDPYRVWVAESMLQQTRVESVLPYYERFVRRFPDPRQLAEASEDEVLGLWSGLGYYRRARDLQAAARIVCERFGGRVPDDPAALRGLPGVGRYTAGAISSIAFGRPEPILDGNVRRVLARIDALDEAALGGAETERKLWERAAGLAHGPDPGALNQSLMELGAVVCRPISPACGKCPARPACKAFALGCPTAFPRPRARKPVVRVRAAVAVVRRGPRVLLERANGASPLRGKWDLPAILADAEADAGAALGAALARRHDGLRVEIGDALGVVRHAILDRALRLEAFAGRVVAGSAARRPGLRWWPLRELDTAPVSGATRKVVRLADGQSGPSPSSSAARGGSIGRQGA